MNKTGVKSQLILIFCVILVFSLSFCLISRTAGASSEQIADVSFKQKSLMVFIVIERLGFNDFDIREYENLYNLGLKGAAGLINVRRTDNLNFDSTFLSADSGKKYISRKIIEDSKNKFLSLDTDYPWGYSTDWNAVKKSFYKYSKENDIIFIKSGDIARIDSRVEMLTAEQMKHYKSKALQKVDEFLGKFYSLVDLSQTTVGIIVPALPVSELRTGQKLSWMMLAGPNIETGLLSSFSTRREGIITGRDFPAVFKQILSGELNTAEENSVYVEKVNRGVSSYNLLKGIYKRITFNYRVRPTFIKIFIFLQILLIIFAVFLSFKKRSRFSVIISGLYEYLILSVLLLPLNFMLVSSTGSFTPGRYVIYLFFFTFSMCFGLKFFIEERMKRLIIINIVIVVFISLDIFRDHYFLADTVLGYSSIIGARYYGLGNEYMGIYAGAFFIVLSCTRQYLKDRKGWNLNTWYWRLSAVLLLMSIIFFTGASDLGANFGGAVTVTVCGIIWLFYSIDKKYAYIGIALLIIIFIIVLYFDFSGLLGVQSHIGRALIKIGEGDFSELGQIILRKYRMNLKLLKWTIWSKILLVFIAYLIFILKKSGAGLKEFFSTRTELKSGFYTCLIGSIAAMLVNDSGVVAAATLLFYPLMSLMYLFPRKMYNIN